MGDKKSTGSREVTLSSRVPMEAISALGYLGRYDRYLHGAVLYLVEGGYHHT